MAALDVESLPLEEKELYVPTLLELQSVLSAGLQRNFRHVTVEVVDCPDLRRAPFDLAAPGLGGSDSALIDIGGPAFLLPHVDRTRVYDLKRVAQLIVGDRRRRTRGEAAADDGLLCIGAGAGYYPLYGTNCEAVYNVRIGQADDSAAGSRTRFVRNVTDDGRRAATAAEARRCRVERVPAEETRSALLVNVFVSEGRPGKVVRVHCRQRIGPADFVTAMRQTLREHFAERDEIVGLGGVFVLRRGSARQHVMPDFAPQPLFDEQQLNEWLRFYEMPAELVALGTLITDDAGLDLRLQHFHSYAGVSTSGKAEDEPQWGGHYHNDTTPDVCEYEGYFAVAERIVRIDRPAITHQFGRD